MTTDVAKPIEFDPRALAEQLRDKIRVDMATLMPDEMWEALLKKEMETFFEKQTTTDYHGRRTVDRPSVFHEIVTEIMREETKKRVRDMLNKPEWDGFWDGQEQRAGEKIEELIKKNAGAILASVLSESISSVVGQMRHNL